MLLFAESINLENISSKESVADDVDDDPSNKGLDDDDAADADDGREPLGFLLIQLGMIEFDLLLWPFTIKRKGKIESIIERVGYI